MRKALIIIFFNYQPRENLLIRASCYASVIPSISNKGLFDATILRAIYSSKLNDMDESVLYAQGW